MEQIMTFVLWAVVPVLAVLCIMYMAVTMYFLVVGASTATPSQIVVLRRLRNYCRSLPRTEAIPVAALERLLDAVEYAEVEIDIDKIVIDEIFNNEKRKGA